MIKKEIIICVGIICSVLLFGCGAKKEDTENSTQVQLANLDAVKFSMVESTEGKLPDSEADGTEKTTTRAVIENTDIYNKPTKGATVIATIEEGSDIAVIGMLSNKEWYKVVYNGRVAYIKASSIEQVEDENIVPEVNDKKNTNSNKTNSQGNVVQNNSAGESENNNEPIPNPNSPASDGTASNTPEPDTTVPDTTVPDDTTEPDTTVPDTTEPDTSAPDIPSPDEPIPDISAPDETQQTSQE